MAPLILDFDGLPGKEILVFNTLSERLVFDKEGHLKYNAPVRPASRVMSDSLYRFELLSPSTGSGSRFLGAAAADFDRDGHFESAETYLDGTLRINYANHPLSVNIGGPIFSGVALGDIDNSGNVAIVFCGDNRIYAYNPNGIPVTNFPIIVNGQNSAGAVASVPTLTDVNGDGKMEIFLGTHNGEIIGVDQNGNRLPNFPKSAGGTIDDPVVFAHSGVSGAIFAISDEGTISAFTSAVPAKVDWNTAYGSAQNLGSFVKSLPTPQPIADPIGYVYNYPNPASDQTTIRFSVKETGDVVIKFYNIAGDLVYNSKMNGIAGIDNEYHMDCTQLSSGVYFCQLETGSGDRKHCTVAIVK